MLIGEDDISNDVITLGTYFSMFVYIRARFRLALIGGNLTVQSRESHGGTGGGIQNSKRRSSKLSFFPPPPPSTPPAARAPRRVCSQAR